MRKNIFIFRTKKYYHRKSLHHRYGGSAGPGGCAI